ncbi:protein-glutamine gamma-glutamyltransferase K-like isoform X2 [Babylonia areolata]|uniref:protein-glutamine gamma-glutamyltransferase K-like isoform X2 n=1 Tax=Babylonia areolata TaxID=304850 RepID=UPI003FD3B897
MPPRRRRAPASSSPSTSRTPKARRRHRYFTSRARRLVLLGGGDQDGRFFNITDDDFRNLVITLKVIDTPGKALGVEKVEKNVLTNSDAHFTTDYESDDLVVRRGMPFDLTVTFDRDIDPDADSVVLQFTVGPRPQESKGTLVRLRLDLKNRSEVATLSAQWSATVSSCSEKVLKVAVSSPATAIIGKYELFVETLLKQNDVKAVRRYEVEDFSVILLFNPWCAGDVVYMSDIGRREEYVLNDRGRIWVGSAFSNHGRPWNFGQFEDPCLEAALTLLDRAELSDSARRSPISVVRAISALANSNDDNGVLEGRWTSKYPKDSTVPWAWTGSVKILQQFMETKKPVRYGQCWVFSGIVTTLLRALGIPTRSVTNFESAHDCDGSMTIDNYVDEDGEPISEMNDSVWNFHVWNESWFRRQDLPEGYDGWQAHDATPQELSEGVMRCGPAPLRAIKEGHVYLNYDVPFVFSEVNGDRVYWKRNEDGDSEVVYINSHAVGKKISTKSIGLPDREDLTLAYKYPEGSQDERRVVEFANRFSRLSSKNIYKKDVKSDVKFELSLADSVMIGEDVKATLKVTNRSGERRTVKGRMSIISTFYTGVPAKRVVGDAYQLELDNGEERTVELEATAKEYQSKLNPEACLQLSAAFTVSATKQHFVTTRVFTLDKPELEIAVPEEIKTGTDYEGTVKFTNPLNINLTGGVIHLEGASVVSADMHEFHKPIKPDETVSYTFKIRPRRAGTREIEATFSSDQLSGVDGSCEFEVKRNIQPMDTE